MSDLVRDLAIVLAGAQRAQLGPSPKLALRRVRERLGWDDGELSAGIEDRLRAALDGLVPDPGRDVIWRREVQPGLAVLVEDSTNVLLELSQPSTGTVRGRSGPLNFDDLANALILARAFAAATVDAEDQARAGHLAELARSELNRPGR